VLGSFATHQTDELAEASLGVLEKPITRAHA
jgi:hypothetical protein